MRTEIEQTGKIPHEEAIEYLNELRNRNKTLAILRKESDFNPESAERCRRYEIEHREFARRPGRDPVLDSEIEAIRRKESAHVSSAKKDGVFDTPVNAPKDTAIHASLRKQFIALLKRASPESPITIQELSSISDQPIIIARRRLEEIRKYKYYGLRLGSVNLRSDDGGFKVKGSRKGFYLEDNPAPEVK